MEGLSEIRDTGPYTTRYSSKGALLPELYKINKAMREGYSVEEIKRKVKKREILTHRSYQNRMTIWTNLNRRCFSLDSWIIDSMLNASESGIDSPEFKSITYLYYVLRDKLTYSVVTDLIWHLWEEKIVIIRPQDVYDFINKLSKENNEISKWRESTRKKLSRSILAALRDYGLLTGVNKKFIQQPTVSDETIYHLLCIQISEGLRGYQIIQSKDWHIFLWDENIVPHYLNRLAMLDWIGFEKSGETVMIELIRKPGENVE